VSLVAFLNQQIKLPDFLHKTVQEMNENNNNIMQHMLAMPRTVDFIINIFIVAILPAVVEELFFRGFLQKMLQLWLKKGHLAVFIAAFVFSLIHRELDKFLPIFMLGLLLGYAYLWSGDLKISMFIHFTNNLLSLMLTYDLQKQGKPYWVDAPSETLPIYAYLGSAILMIGLMYYFKIKAQQSNVLAYESDKTEEYQ
jgi:membrane protease YdiL (CAAX protease family)